MRENRWCLVCATKSKRVWTNNNITIFKNQPPNTVPKGSRLLQHTWCRKTHKDICAHACNTFSHTHKHTHTNGSQVLWIIQWNKSKHNNICTQIQTTQSSHGLWPSKHTDKEQTTLTDMQKSYTRPHQKVVLGMVLPWLWNVKATKTFGALFRPKKSYAEVLCSDSTLGVSPHAKILLSSHKICSVFSRQ